SPAGAAGQLGDAGDAAALTSDLQAADFPIDCGYAEAQAAPGPGRSDFSAAHFGYHRRTVMRT
ncbi:MAG TPA: hypothetical protein PLW65_25585, partial [Pseudomonadota bacterium]|nr:hypothetical protein [Pseudomonadota bacterium]